MSDRDKQSEMDRRAREYADKEYPTWAHEERVYKETVIDYKQGWTDALKHAPEVLELVEALANIVEADIIQTHKGLLIGDIGCIADKALDAYQKAIEEQK